METMIVAYVVSWKNSNPDPTHVTHINYAFGSVIGNCDKVGVTNPNRLRNIVELKNAKSDLKVLLSIGGWGAGGFSEMARDKTKRMSFAVDCKRVVDEFNLDGIDMDWEYPTQNAGGRIAAHPDDTKNFTLLMRDIRAATGNNKLLTFASPCANYVDFKEVEPYVDFINIMAYDMASHPYHQAGLYRSQFTEWMSCEESVMAHYKAGIPMDKLTLGIPFYGRRHSSIVPSGDNAISYSDIVNTMLNNPAYTKKWDDCAKAPYMTNTSGSFILTYDDEESIAEKCKFIRKHGMLGAMFWEFDHDDSNGRLRNAVFRGLKTKVSDTLHPCHTAEPEMVIDIGGSGVRIGVVSEHGVASIQRESIHSMDELIRAIKARATHIKGIAISVPGFVYADSGQVLLSQVAPYLEGNLKEKLETAFPGTRIYIVNDGEAHALALLTLSNVKLGAINLSIGTALGFGVLNEKGKILRTLSGENWDIGSLWLKTRAPDPSVWWALGQNGFEELQRSMGEKAYEHFGYRLGAFASQLAIIFRPQTIGFSGGFIARYWDKMENAVKSEFQPPTLLSPQLVAQKDTESALVSLSILFKHQ